MIWILDAVALLLFLLLLWIGYRRGFFKTVMRLVSGILAVGLAMWLSAPIAGGAFDLFLQGSLQKGLEQQLASVTNAVDDSMATGVDRFLEGLPGVLQRTLEEQGVRSGQEALSKLSLSGSVPVSEASAAVTRNVIRPAVVPLLQVVCFFLLFLALWLVLGLLTRLIGGVLRLPVLRQVDGALGAVAGAVEGLLLVCVLSTLVGWQSRMAAPDGWVSQEMLEQTIVVRHLDFSEKI